MSTQAMLVKGVGYRFNYEDLLFSHIDDKDKEFHFINLLNLDLSYYDTRDKGSSKDANLKVIVDGRDGTGKWVMFVTEVSKIENTHGDSYWINTYRNDTYIREYAKQNIETLLGRKMTTEPKEITFESWH